MPNRQPSATTSCHLSERLITPHICTVCQSALPPGPLSPYILSEPLPRYPPYLRVTSASPSPTQILPNSATRQNPASAASPRLSPRLRSACGRSGAFPPPPVRLSASARSRGAQLRKIMLLSAAWPPGIHVTQYLHGQEAVARNASPCERATVRHVVSARVVWHILNDIHQGCCDRARAS